MIRREAADRCAKQEKHETKHFEKEIILAVSKMNYEEHWLQQSLLTDISLIIHR